MLISHGRWRRSNGKGSSKIFHWKSPGEAVSGAGRKKCLHWKALRLKREKQYCLGRWCDSTPLYPNLVGGGGRQELVWAPKLVRDAEFL